MTNIKPTQTARLLSAMILSATTIQFPSAVQATLSSSKLRYCNRGYCYTKREPELYHQQIHNQASDITHTSTLHGTPDENKKHWVKHRSGLDFCTDTHGHVMDCELFEILDLDQDEVDVQYESLESVGSGDRTNTHRADQLKDDTSIRTCVYSTLDGGVIELDELKRNYKHGHISWKERPQKGTCLDNRGFAFDCRLLEVLDEGNLLIEDLRAGGMFTEQPKAGFTTRKTKKKHAKESAHTPDVLRGSGLADPMEDFRTNVFLNLEGF